MNLKRNGFWRSSPAHESHFPRRRGDLTRLALWLEQPRITVDDGRRTGAERLERLERLYPIDCHVRRQRWQALAGDG